MLSHPRHGACQHTGDGRDDLSPFIPYSLLLGIAVAVVVLDQSVKAIVRATLGGGRVIELLGGAVRLDYTSNTGAAFGIFRAGGLLFALIASAVSLGIVLYYRRIAASPLVVRVALGLILGGAVGNLIDRLRFGYVIDFIDLRWWPVFNVADSSIVVGVCLLVLYTMLQPSTDGSSPA
jgi:signal peptidase II